MNVSSEVSKWLKENAYAVKKGEYWFLPDFPKDQMPDKLEIPVRKGMWQALKELVSN